MRGAWLILPSLVLIGLFAYALSHNKPEAADYINRIKATKHQSWFLGGLADNYRFLANKAWTHNAEGARNLVRFSGDVDIAGYCHICALDDPNRFSATPRGEITSSFWLTFVLNEPGQPPDMGQTGYLVTTKGETTFVPIQGQDFINSALVGNTVLPGQCMTFCRKGP